MANGEDLVYDWQHNVVDDPTEWAFNWDYAEGGTSKPVAREHHATMWLIMNEDDPVYALKVFFKRAGREHPIQLQTKAPSRNDDDEDEYKYKFTVIHKRTKEVLMKGTMQKPDPDSPDPNVGNYAMFKSTTKDGTALMKKLVNGALIHGMLAYIPHSRVETPLSVDGYKVVSITGEGPDGEEGRHSELATRFTLFHNDEEVARCHMTYRDATYDPSMGPTIEMIAVKQSRRGEGLARVLWYWVRRFIEENFTIECLNNDALPKHIMIKATQIGMNEVDIRTAKDGTMHPVGFKGFLYDYCEFSVREQKGAVAFLFSSRRPKDEEAVLYIPLLTKQALAARKSGADNPKAPKPGRAYLREKNGARMCQWCSNVAKELRMCARCGVAFYCNPTCQKNDWKRHKKWCGKTREQVREKLIKEGGMFQNEDGTYTLVMNGPGRSFGGGFGGLSF